MPDRYGRMDWRDRDVRARDYRAREPRVDDRDYRREPRIRDDDPLEDYGQADFSQDYAYDPDTRTGYKLDPQEEARRRYEEEHLTEADRYADDRHRGDRSDYVDRDPYRDRYSARADEPRSWTERSGLSSMFAGRSGRRASNDRVLWVVATEALHKARGIDGSDVHVTVEDGIVTLEGTARSREEKRRIEDLVDQRGVRDVHNHLRIRERRFGF
jgi:hypothetical protein